MNASKPCANTFAFVIGRDSDGTPCLDMYAVDRHGHRGSLPIAYITREQLATITKAQTLFCWCNDSSRCEYCLDERGRIGWLNRGINDMDAGA